MLTLTGSSADVILNGLSRPSMLRMREHWIKILWALVPFPSTNWWNLLVSRSRKQVNHDLGLFLEIRCWLLQVYRVHPPSNGKKILVACGPGNNGSHNPIHEYPSWLKIIRWWWFGSCSSPLPLWLSANNLLSQKDQKWTLRPPCHTAEESRDTVHRRFHIITERVASYHRRHLRLQLLRGSTRSFQGRHWSFGEDRRPCTLCWCSFFMEYRRWTTIKRARGEVPSSHVD